MDEVEIYPATAGYKASPDYRVEVEGRPVQVGTFSAGAFAAFGIAGRATVTIRGQKPLGPRVARPLAAGAVPTLSETSAELVLEGPGRWYLEFGSGPALMLFANPLETAKPHRETSNLLFFGAGRVHDVGHLELVDGQTVYVEGGAVVKGLISASGKTRVAVRGFGVLDARHYPAQSSQMLTFEGCRGVQVEGLVCVGTPGTNLALTACEEVEVRGVKLVGWLTGAPAIEVSGCSAVAIENSFIRSNGDAISIGAWDARDPEARPREVGPVRDYFSGARNCEGVRVSGCIIYQDRSGNVLSVGPRLDAPLVSNLEFENLDILHTGPQSAVLGVDQRGDGAVEGVRVRDVRVEQLQSKFLDVRCTGSGRIANVGLQRVQLPRLGPQNVSLLAGCDANSLLDPVRLDDVNCQGQPVLDETALGLFSRYAEPPVFS